MALEIVHDGLDPGELQALYSTHWWFDGRSTPDIRQSVECADEVIGIRCDTEDRLIASARVITDYVFTGKILDVIVAESRRREGIGTRLLSEVTEHSPLQDVNELTVNCREGLVPFYESCGFHSHEMIGDRSVAADEDYYVMVYE